MLNFRVFFQCLAAALCLFAAFSSVSRADAPARTWTTVSCRSSPGRLQPLITVVLNSTTTATFVLDTGSYVSAVSDTLVKKMGLVPQPYLLAEGRPFILNGKPLNKVDAAPLGIGEGKTQLAIMRYPLAVFAAKELAPVYGPGVDGIIGTDLLRFMAVRLDCPQHQVTFWYPGNLTPAELVSDGFGHSLIVPVTDPDHNALYYVQGQFQNGLNTATEKMRVDTGISGTFVSPAVASALKLTPDMTGKIDLFETTATLFRAKVPSARFGDLTLHDFPIYYYEKEDSANPISLGMDVLSGYRVLLDYAHGTVYLKPTVPDHINILSK